MIQGQWICSNHQADPPNHEIVPKAKYQALLDRLAQLERDKGALYKERNQMKAMLDLIAAIPAVDDSFHAPNEECIADGVESAVEHLQSEVARLKSLLNRDHTGLAAALNRVQQVIQGFTWMARGEWGSYMYDEQTTATLQREIGHCFEQLNACASLALRESGIRADASVHPERDRLVLLEQQVVTLQTSLTSLLGRFTRLQQYLHNGRVPEAKDLIDNTIQALQKFPGMFPPTGTPS